MSQYYKFDKTNGGRQAGVISLGQAIQQYLESNKLRGKLNEISVSAQWESIMGKGIANRTSQVYVANKKLFLQITSAPLREELAKGKGLIIRNINEELGEGIVEDVVFI